MNELIDPKTIWESRYAQKTSDQIRLGVDLWLKRWNDVLKTSNVDPILDLGCGSGVDSRYLSKAGFSVMAVDYSEKALNLARQLAPKAKFAQLDLRQGLPFPNDSFRVIIANLSLHYFPWDQTEILVQQIRECLKNDGFLLTRFNSIKNLKLDSTHYEEVAPGYFRVKGLLKRYVVREDLEKLFQLGWKMQHLEEMEIDRYRHPKIVWEAVLQKI